jgi:hypothetical protein
MPSMIDITGQRYGRLTALSKSDSVNKRTYWNCVCDCGSQVKARTGFLRNGKTSSCGCYQKESARQKMLKHGRADKKNNKAEFVVYTRETHIKRKYGLDMDTYNQMLKDQDNKCAICSYEFGQKQGDTYVDHCHTTKEVRGLLCQHCNSGLGYFRDNQDNLAKAIKYLQEK